MTMDRETPARDTVALVALLEATKRRWSDIRVELDEYGPEDLLRRELGSDLLSDHASDALHEALQKVRVWRSDGIRVLSPFDSEYPSQLAGVHDYPPLLFARGNLNERDASSIAVVGTRKPSEGALRFINRIVPLLAADGLPIVSGLAKGVDGAAMRASLAAGNRTVGIIGTGVNRSYPAENRDLQTVVSKDHLLLSQFWPDAPPSRQSFPMRNHVMSAFSSMTLIVEASEQSGTRIQARAATKHGRPLLISKAVYMQTQWAKDLVRQRFDVTVFSNEDEALQAVRAIRDRETASRSALNHLRLVS